MKVLITGATGFIGRRIVRELLAAGDEVVVLSRNISRAPLILGNQCQYFKWEDPSSVPPLEAFKGVEGVLNLMGEGIAEKKWTEEQKKKIYDSRIQGTANLVEALKKLDKKPSVLVSTSAVGIYGNRGEERITEEATLAEDFLAGVCKDWEKEALKAEGLGLRVAIIRTGVVLGRDGGALKKMLPVFKLGLGGPLGDGQQYMSWIHVDDLSKMYVVVLKDSSLSGVFNGTAPYPVTNKDFTKALGKALGRPTVFPAPAFALNLIFGEMSQVLLQGQRVIPEKLKAKNFRYNYPTLEMALKETAF